jgi:uncharacterized protein (TIGR01777 family)
VNVLIAGGSGFIGSALTRRLLQRGHKVSLLSRRPSAPSGAPPLFHWDSERGEFDGNALTGTDAVVNLAGESLAGGRWTRERKRRLVESRVGATRFLVQRMGERKAPPRTLVSFSATGIYGNRGEEVLTEESPPGVGFLADLCRAWEGAALPARDAGARVVLARCGIVLDARGGALASLLPMFKLGLGGPLGNGKQWMSWVSLPDVVQILEMALERDDMSTAVNVVSPAPVRNREFARVLGRALRRPAILPAPAPALRLVLGEMADEALLSSACVAPKRLTSLGYRFAFEDLDRALRNTLRA